MNLLATRFTRSRLCWHHNDMRVGGNSGLRLAKVLLLVLGVALVEGCASRKMYSWGRYQDLVYASYVHPDKVPTAKQVERMEADYRKAAARHRRVHPGFHAHLGHLYLQLGKTDAAREQFEKEKAEFPESAVLVDRLLSKLTKHESAAAR